MFIDKMNIYIHTIYIYMYNEYIYRILTVENLH